MYCYKHHDSPKDVCINGEPDGKDIKESCRGALFNWYRQDASLLNAASSQDLVEQRLFITLMAIVVPDRHGRSLYLIHQHLCVAGTAELSKGYLYSADCVLIRQSVSRALPLSTE